MEVNGYTIKPGAGLSGANLKGADLTGAVADGRTVWPGDFNPDNFGVYKIGPEANHTRVQAYKRTLRPERRAVGNLDSGAGQSNFCPSCGVRVRADGSCLC